MLLCEYHHPGGALFNYRLVFQDHSTVCEIPPQNCIVPTVEMVIIPGEYLLSDA